MVVASEQMNIELEEILAEFSSEIAQNSIIQLAIDAGVSVPFSLVERVANSHDYKATRGEIFEMAGCLTQARRLYKEYFEERSGEEWAGLSAGYARKAGAEEQAKALYKLAISSSLEKELFPQALELVIEFGDKIEVEKVYQRGVKFYLKEGSFWRTVWKKIKAKTDRERVGCDSLRYQYLRYAAEMSLKMGNWQQAIGIYCQNRDFLSAAKLSELTGKDRETINKLYRKEISFLKRRDFYTAPALALMLGDLDMAIRLKLKNGDYKTAAELAFKKGDGKKAKSILREGIEYCLERAQGHVHEEEKGTLRGLVFEQQKHILRFVRRKPELAYAALLWTAEQKRSLPSYEKAAEHLVEAAELCTLAHENENAQRFYVQALEILKKSESSDISRIASLAKKANDQESFNWAYTRLMDRSRKDAEKWPTSANISFGCMAKWAEELSEEKDAIIFYKLADNYVDAAKVNLKKGWKREALQCYDEGGDLGGAVYPAVDLALELGEKEKAREILSRAAPRLLGGETSSVSNCVNVGEYALVIEDITLLREAYQKSIESIEKYGLGDMSEHRAKQIEKLVGLSAALGEESKEKAFQKITGWMKKRWDIYLNSNRNFFLKTNSEEPLDVRLKEANLRELIHCYETKVKPLGM